MNRIKKSIDQANRVNPFFQLVPFETVSVIGTPDSERYHVPLGEHA